MKPTTLNRWLKPLIWLWVFVIIVMLLIPAELTDEQLRQIKPGMTIQQAEQLLGEPCRKGGMRGISISSRGIWSGGNTWYLEGSWYKPNVIARIPNQEILLSDSRETWIGKHHLLWVEHENELVTKTWLFPISRTGGGFQGCIDTIKDYRNQWMGK